MIDVIFLAIALSMDAFAVSLTLGTRNAHHVNKVALLAALYFGVFQAVMPLLGYLGGVAMFAWFGNFAHWIAFILLVMIGLKMMYEAIKPQSEVAVAPPTYSHYALLILAIATSIDALAAGFTLTLLSVNGVYACILIGLITFMFSYIGVHIGRRTSHWLGNKAEFFGGIVLVLLGCKILIF